MARVVLSMLAVGAGLLGSAALSACGGSGDALPDDAVAKVGDAVITKADFERALRFASGRAGDPRDFATCAAAKQQNGTTADGTQPPEAQLVKQCRDEFEKLKRVVMDYLIEAEWTRQEAEARGIVLTESELTRAIEEAKESGFLDPEALEEAGVTKEQLIVRLRQSQLQAKVTRQVTKPSGEVSESDIAHFYGRHKSELVVPERRDLRIIITRTRAKARAARRALESGQGWRRAARKYSLHEGSRDEGGRITGLKESEQTTGLVGVIFRATRGELTGPVKGDENWAVLLVDRVKPSFQATLEQSRDEIEDHLRDTRAQRALDAYTGRYRDRTTCAPGFKVPDCGNAPQEPDAGPTS
jgi:foldase protein PrsA